MRSLRFLIPAAIALLLLFTFVPTGAAQQQVVATELSMNVDFLGEGNTLDRGEQTEGFVTGQICYEAGGFNPLSGEFVLRLTFSGNPDWLDVRITGGDTVRWRPPTGPEAVAACEAFPDFSLRATALEDAPYSTTGTVDFAIDVSAEGDTGTYQIPASTTASGSIPISEDPGDEPDFDPDATPPPPPPPPEESPAVPVLLVVLTLLGVLRLRRRV